MKESARLLFVFVSLAIVVATAEFVLSRNLRAGLYPWDGDTIAIPLFETLLVVVLVAGMVLLQALLSRAGWARRRMGSSPAWRRALLGVSAVLVLLAMVLLILWGFAWLNGDHFMISIACGLSAIAVGAWGLGGLRQQLNSGASVQVETPVA